MRYLEYSESNTFISCDLDLKLIKPKVKLGLISIIYDNISKFQVPRSSRFKENVQTNKQQTHNE